MATATYNTSVQSSQATGTGAAVSYYSIRTTLTGAGRILTRRPLGAQAPALTLGQRYEFATNEFILTLPEGDFEPDGAEYTLERLTATALYVSLHTTDSEGAEATYSGYARILLAIGNWIYAE